MDRRVACKKWGILNQILNIARQIYGVPIVSPDENPYRVQNPKK